MTRAFTRESVRCGAGIVAIAATYIYFLIFAQFAFLELFTKQFQSPQLLDQVMAAMGISGIVLSFAAVFLYRRWSPENVLGIGFLWAAASGVVAPFCQSLESFSLVAANIGASLALITVSLASDLSRLIPRSRYGLYIGAATGVAYATCNLPIVFSAPPRSQAVFSSIIVLLGAAAIHLTRGPAAETKAVEVSIREFDYSSRGMATMVLSFLALVWLDCAAFYIIQQTGELKNSTWSEGHLLLNASIHFVAALGAGILIDRGCNRALLLAAHVLLSSGILLLGHYSVLSGPLYCAGVSLYSTVLVSFPARLGNRPGLLPVTWRAALIYGISGWLGSALGIGMAKELDRVPISFLLISFVVLVASALWSARRKSDTTPTGLYVLLCALLGASLLGVLDTATAENTDDLIAQGRSVYLAEGCINCHSQYVRPFDIDRIPWGPFVPPEEVINQAPPLIGNRRNGPDLLNVGLRRNYEWLKLHLISPSETSPGSSMPSYAHLFQNDSRGEALVLYLQNLGSSRRAARIAQIRAWTPSSDANADVELGAVLYSQRCAQCHGVQGRGDGSVAQRLVIKPRNLVEEPMKYFDESSSNSLLELARVVKFGVMGTSMPGQEYLDDVSIVSIAEFVRGLRSAVRPSSSLPSPNTDVTSKVTP